MENAFHIPPGEAGPVVHVLTQAAHMLSARTDVAPGTGMLVAVSGGADSVCLFDALRLLGLRVEIAHVDHQTRGGQSAEDAAFVAKLAQAAAAPCHVHSVDAEAEAAASGAGFEAHARMLRYAFFERIARERGLPLIATGHTADDQAETVLMRALRGTSPHGLGGIPPVRNGDGATIVRPLLACTRADVLRYIAARGLAFREDASNADPRHLRNRMRRELLPLIRERFNPGVDAALIQLAAIQRDESAFLDQLTEGFLQQCAASGDSLDRAAFAVGHPALQRRAMTRLMLEHGTDPVFERIEAALEHLAHGQTGSGIDLGAGVALRLTRTEAVFEDTDAAGLPPPEAVTLAVPGEAVFGPWRVRAVLLPRCPEPPLEDYCTPSRQVFDADALGDVLTLRTRRPGDRIAPLGMAGTRKLKDWMIDAGIPRSERDALLIIQGKCGIAWVVGGPVSRESAVTERTARVLEIEATHAD